MWYGSLVLCIGLCFLCRTWSGRVTGVQTVCSSDLFCFFFFNDTATTEIYTLSLHDALPILASSSFTTLLKSWRHQRGYSQLSLALASDVSQRHLSFLESGRSQPSRDMILRLGNVLEIPFRDQDRKSTRLNSSHPSRSRMPSSA